MILIVAHRTGGPIVNRDSGDWNVCKLQEGPRHKKNDDDYDESNCQVAQCRKESLAETVLFVCLVEEHGEGQQNCYHC